MNYSNVPVLILIFNRPDLTKRLIDGLRKAAPKHLFVAADGPRPDRPGEAEICAETRAVVSTIDWECTVQRLFRDQNLGCRAAVSSAITWFFEQVPEGMILEDDCIPNISFFPYCAELLERYRNSDKVGMISGTSAHDPKCGCTPSESYSFSKYPQIWGWATWARVWNKYDVNISSWNGDPKVFKDWFPSWGAQREIKRNFDKVRYTPYSTWDYQLQYLCCKGRLLSIVPNVNLIDNVGFDERATHTTSADQVAALPVAREMPFPLVHPPRIEISKGSEACIERRMNLPASRFHLPFRWLAARLRGLLRKG